jgi:putative ABC transport system ATP-binding protein
MKASRRHPTETVAISLDTVSYTYPNTKKKVIDIDQWQLKKGEHVFIQGRSGSGKSTLLNLLTGILMCKDKGIQVLGHTLADMSVSQRDAFRAQHIGVVFQQFNLVPYLSVLENIALAAYFAGTSKDVVEHTYRELFQGLSLPLDLINQRADQLSVGQQQRVAIARALINTPELLIVDEPTSALDYEAKNEFLAMLMSIVKKNNTTLVFVSHDVSLQPFFSSTIHMSDLNKAGVNHAA